MCPILCILPFIVIVLLLVGINKYLRSLKIQKGDKTVFSTGKVYLSTFVFSNDC